LATDLASSQSGSMVNAAIESEQLPVELIIESVVQEDIELLAAIG
jgi:hypothetical protein